MWPCPSRSSTVHQDMGRRNLANGVGGQGRGGASGRGSGVRVGGAGNGYGAPSCVTQSGARAPLREGLVGQGGEYKTRGGARAAIEGVKFWPGAVWAHYGDTGRAPGCVEK